MRFFRTLFPNLGLLALCLAALSVPSQAAVFNPQTFTLANGMQVVVVPNRRAPVVVHMVWYRAGRKIGDRPFS